MTEAVREPAEAERALEFEQLVVDVSAQVVSARDKEFTSAVVEAIGRIVQFFGADRGGLLMVSDDRHTIRVVLAWYSDPLLQRVSGDLNLFELFPYGAKLLVEEAQPFIVESYADAPAEAARDRATHEAMGVRSTLNLPIVVDDAVRYIVTIDAMRREVRWPASYVPRLRLLGEIIASTFERHRVSDALRASEARLTLAVRSAGAGIWDLDVVSGRIWATSEAKLLYGFQSDADVTLDMVMRAVHPEDADRVRRRIADVAGTGEEFTDEYRLVLPGGSVRWVAARGRAHVDPGSASRHVLGVSVEVTRRKQEEAERQADEARLQAAVDVAGLGFYVMTDGGRTVDADDRARGLLGLPAGQTTGIRDFWLDHVHAADRERVLELSRGIVSGRVESGVIEYRYDHPTKGLTWLSHSSRAVTQWSMDHRVSAVGVLQDITRLKAGEEALRDHAEQFLAMTTTTADGFWVVDEQGRIVDANDECSRVYGYERRELLRLSIKDIEATRDEAQVRAHFREIMSTGFSRFETRHKRKDGRVIDVEVSTTFRPGPGTFLAFLRDITQRKQAEERLKRALADIQQLRDRLERENVYLRQETSALKGLRPIVGRSPAIRRVMQDIEKVAGTDSTVLLLGETGTGKELFASAIHNLSSRRDRTMVRVNCAAIPATLIEAELFGRERGAYTGALSKQVGRFEMASGSTIFLDEIGDLPMDIQVKLLRVLQERQIERLGSPRPVNVDLRIIAATNHDLEKDVLEGRFRQDLYYRLDVFPIKVPPLRERPEDLQFLVEALVDELAGRFGKRFESVARSSMEAIRRYHWPGNVRELRNVIERAMILASGPVLDISLPESRMSAEAPPPAATAGMDKASVLRVLEQCGWRIRGSGGAAERLGLKPTTVEYRMARLGIKRP